uniref:MARVEL domain-containing protein n=1 Tax=Macrostomum lignano TaxID=282301 RepID=A0A1I8HN11_9PLAT
YGLISAAVCFKLFRKVGAPCSNRLSLHRRQPQAVRSFKMFTTCHKSHKGLFFGLLIVILIVVPLATLVLLPKPDKDRRDAYTIAVLAAECSVLLITAALCCAGACRSLSSLSVDKTRGREDLDGKLLLVGLSGLLCYNLFVVVSSASCLMDEHTAQQGSDHCLFGTGRSGVVTKLNGLKSLLDGAQALSQTFLIA